MSASSEVDLDRLKGISILLAEDNVTNQLVATQMLESLGAEVDIAADGAIALERLKVRTYDVLLIDIEMPRVSGLDVIRAIRADDGPLATAPVIALTAYAMHEHREKILRVGADGLISKPITSIRQFGIDILTLMDERVAKASGQDDEEPEENPVIERIIYENLAASVGEMSMPELLRRVANDLAEAKTAITAAAASDDADQMHRASHVLCAIAGSLGAVRLESQAERLNCLANEEDAAGTRKMAEEILPELGRVIAFIRNEQRGRAA